MRQIAYGGGQMERREYVIYSSHLKKDMHIIQYGHSGLPIIGFPTQCAPCTNYEDFGATRVLEPYFEEGQMQLFCVETVDGESWCCKDGINTWRSARQESYHRFIVDEVIPFIQKFYTQGMRPFVIGDDLGATQAAITFFRRPELFCGRGAWEDECYRTLRYLDKILHKKRISAMIDYWGEDVSHDWPWWRHQLEYFIPIVIREQSLVTLR